MFNPEEQTYEVRLSCNFEATSPLDALMQMCDWAAENAYQAGYRVIGEDGSEVFMDAEKAIYQEGLNDV